MAEMKKQSVSRIAGALVGGIALIGSGAVAAVDMAVAQDIDDVQAPASKETDLQEIAALNQVENVEGTFGFSQDVVTPTERIASVFRVAATSFCSSMPEYFAYDLAQKVKVGGSAASSTYVGTVADMAEEEESTSFVLACSCASNIAGGGAIANAEVSGVSLDSVARIVGAM